MSEQDLKIGGVRLNLSHFQEGATYSDGDVEEHLLNIVMTHSHYEEVLKDNSDWAILYHLHPMRENLLSWYNFTGREYALDIGAGCGALTGLLAQNCKKVICSELSRRRAKINAYKNAECDNV